LTTLDRGEKKTTLKGREEGRRLTDLLETEVIKRGEEDRKRGVDTHDPCEGKAIISTTQQHSRLGNDLAGSHERFPQGTSLLSAFPLFDAYQSPPARLRNWLLRGRDVTVVESFFAEESYEQETNSCHHS
jgi:hypothetical protein